MPFTAELFGDAGDDSIKGGAGDDVLLGGDGDPGAPGLVGGQVIGLLEFQTAVEGIFDVQVLADLRFPEVVGFQKDAVHHTFIVPSGDGFAGTR